MADKGVIIEFDFAVFAGAELLHKTTSAFLKNLDKIPFNDVLEAKYLAGGNYQGGFAEYFPTVKTKKTAAKAGKDLSAAFNKALTEKIASAITPQFKNFVKALVDKGVKVVIATRADIEDESIKTAFAPLLGEKVVLYHEESACYGAVKWDSWLRACAKCGLNRVSTIAVAGSGHSVKSALVAGMGSMAVVNDRVAYQDFGGADDVVKELSGPTAKRLLEILRVD